MQKAENLAQIQENCKKPANIRTNYESLLKKSVSLNFEPDFLANSSKKSLQNRLEAWISLEGPRVLCAALQKLRIDAENIKKNCENCCGLQELEEKKRAVKQELKNYDSIFQENFGRLPIRNEKEPMRPLYVFYKKIKQKIEDFEKNCENSRDFPKKTQESKDFPRKTQESKELSRKNKEFSQKPEEFSQKPEQFSQKNEESKEFSEKNQRIYAEKSLKKPEKSLVKLSAKELRQRADELKRQKNELRVHLHSFQQDFTKENNRKIKYHKDIAPVEQEYKKYKEIKAELLKLEEILDK